MLRDSKAAEEAAEEASAKVKSASDETIDADLSAAERYKTLDRTMIYPLAVYEATWLLVPGACE